MYWKPSSLQIITGGTLVDVKPNKEVEANEGAQVLRVVTEMLVLGTKIENTGRSSAAPEYRFTLASKSFASIKRRCISGVSVKVALQTLARVPNSVLAFDAGNIG